MKIIKVDNFNRESISDALVAGNVEKYYGEVIVDLLNNKYGGEHSPNYFKLVDDNYKLYVFEP